MKVALLGSCPSSRMRAPFDDPEWLIWACSPLDMGIFPRVDAWFEIHGDWDWPEAVKPGKEYLEWLRKQSFIVFANRTDLIANSVKFPAKELVQEYGPYWFTSTFAWMFAFALTQGATEIGIYGADMSTRNEYLYQKPAMHRWIELAQARGIKITVPPESDLLQPPELYGYSFMSPMGRKMAVHNAELKFRIAKLENEIKQREEEKTYLRGSLDINDYTTIVWTGGIDSIVDSTDTEF